MSATPEEVQAIYDDLKSKHGAAMVGVVMFADFVAVATDKQLAPDTREFMVSSLKATVALWLRELDKTFDDYSAACVDFYQANSTVRELNALPD